MRRRISEIRCAAHAAAVSSGKGASTVNRGQETFLHMPACMNGVARLIAATPPQ